MSWIAGGPLLARTPPPSIHRVRPHVTPIRTLTAASPSPSPMEISQVVRPHSPCMRCASFAGSGSHSIDAELARADRNAVQISVSSRSLQVALRQSHACRINPLVWMSSYRCIRIFADIPPARRGHTGHGSIPGGPKLPRTPQGPQSVGARSGVRTPAPSPEQAAAASHDSPKVSFAPGSQASSYTLLAAWTPATAGY